MKPVLLSLLALASLALPAQETREMMRDTRSMIAREGAAIWTGFERTAFQVMLVESDRETLFCHAPIDGFRALGTDTLTRCAMQMRARTFDVDSAASLDFRDQPALVVIGTPAALARSTAEWRLTLLHENFHQFQNAHPGFRQAVARLGIARSAGDGSWMLDYPFPYADPHVGTAFDAMNRSAAMFLDAKSPAARRRSIAAYVAARHAAQALVGRADWTYYEFQIGQEGIARWTELAVAETAARRDPAFRTAARDHRGGLAASLRAIDDQGLRVWKRSAFYVYGVIEAEMLEALGVPWRKDYFERPFAFGDRLDDACARARCEPA